MDVDPTALLEARLEALILENRLLKALTPEGMHEREMRLIEREQALEQQVRATSLEAASQQAIFQQVAGGNYVH